MIKALDNRSYVKFMQLEIGLLGCLINLFAFSPGNLIKGLTVQPKILLHTLSVAHRDSLIVHVTGVLGQKKEFLYPINYVV